MIKYRILLAILLALTAGAVADAADRDVEVRFKTGTTSAAYTDRIKGYDAVNYYLDAAGGQRLAITFSKNKNSCYFNVLSPTAGETLVEGSAIDPGGLILSESGRYRIVVYLMRATARRGATCDFLINMQVTD